MKGKNLIIDILRRLEKRKKDEILINGFIKLRNTRIYLDINIYTSYDMFNRYDINKLNKNNYRDYIDIDLYYYFNNQIIYLDEEKTEKIFLNDILELLFDENLTYKELKEFNYCKYNNNYVYPIGYYYYNHFTYEPITDFDNYMFNIDLY